MKQLLFFCSFFIFSISAKAQTSYTWNGATSTAWNTATNWTPNGIPVAIDNVTIVTGGNNCILPASQSITNLTITTGVLNLGGNTLTSTGVVSAAGGQCNNGTLSATGISQTFSGTTFGANINIVPATTNDVYFNGSIFNGSVTVIKNSGNNIQGTGNNTFNGVTSLTNNGTGYFMLTNGGPGRNDIFNQTVTFNTTNTGSIYIGYNRNATFNANVTVNNTASTGNTVFGSGPTGGIITLGAGVTINCGSFVGGNLIIYRLVQSDATALTLNPGINGGAGIYGSSTVTGNLTITAGNIYTQGSTFNGTVTLNKTGGLNNASAGGNTFNGLLTMNHTGVGYWGMGNGAADIFNADVYLNNNCSNERILIGQNSSNNQINGNVYVTSIGSSQNIWLGWGGTYPIVQMGAGKSVFVGAAGFTAGGVVFNKFAQSDATAITLAGTGTSAVTITGSTIFTGAVNFTTPDIYVQGGTFNSTASFTKTGNSSDHNNGNLNIFNSTCTINQQGSGYFMLGYNSADAFNDNITVTSSGTGGIYLGWVGGTGTPTLASGKTISVGGAGFSAGFLYLNTFTQLGNAAMNLTFTGTAYMTIARNSVIGGNLIFTGASFTHTGGSILNGTANITAITGAITYSGASTIAGNLICTSADVYFNGCTFNGTVNATKTGSNGQWGAGGDIFNGVTTINQLGSGFLGFANGAADIFNADVYLNNNCSNERILIGQNSSNNQFNGNIILTQIGSSQGIAFGWNAATTITLAAGKTISIGAAGYNVGYLQIERFIQLGNAAMNLPLTGTSSLTFGPTATIGGNLVSTSASLFYNGCTFNGRVDGTKNGVSSDASSGGNIFQGASSFTNNGSGYLILGNGTADTWNADVTFTDLGTERILPCWNSAGNQFNGNIIVNSTGSAVGINFCGGTVGANATQAAGFAISVGGLGFNSGYLILQRFTQLGNAATNLILTSPANYLQFGPSSAFGGNVTSSSPGLYFNGCTFSGTVNSTKTGATNDGSLGSNIFNGATTMTNSGTGYLLFGSGNADQFNSTSTFNNTGSNNIYVAYNSSNNIFGGDVTFNNTPTANTIISVSPYSTGSVFNGNIVVTSNNGQGVQFCGGNATATATLSATKTISVGAGGFSSGTLLLKQFTQVGPTAQALTLTGTGNLTVGPASAFGGNVNFLAPLVYLNGCTYSGIATIEKNGAVDNNGSGGNIFNGVTTITNSGSGYLMTGNGNADQFNAVTTFNNTGSYRIFLAYNHPAQTTTFANNVTFNSNKSGGVDGWSFFICEGNNTNVSFGGNVIINNAGAIQSNCRILNGSGGTATYTGNLTINVSNTNASTQMQMGVAGISTNNGNIIVSNSGGANGIYFNVNATASSTLANTKTITVGAGGFNAGILSLIRFTQIGGTAQALTLTGTGNLTLGPLSAFGGNVNFLAPQVYLNGCTYSGIATIEKNGAVDNSGSGGNIFNGVTTITNSGSGYLMTGNGNADQFNAVTTFNNTGSYRIFLAYNHAAQTTTFANNVTFNSNKSGGVDGWSFFICEGNNTNISFGGNVIINNTGAIQSNCRFLLGAGTLATYNGDLTINVTNTNASTQMQMGATSTSAFNGNIIVSNSGGAGGIYFNGGAAASSILANTKTISIGAGGFNAGILSLIRFTQIGGTAQALTLTGTANLTFGPTSAFGGNVTCTSPTLFFNGCTFSGTTNCTKNGTTNDASIGNNIFTGVSTMNNSGSGYFMFGNGNTDQWLTDATFNNTGSNIIYLAYSSTNNAFSGNVTLNNVGSTGNNSGIYVCANANSTGSTTGNFIVNNNPTSGINNGIRVCEGNSTSFTVGGTTNITNTNTNTSNYIRFANGTGSSTTFAGDVTVTNNGTVASTNVVHFGYTGSSTFNGNITLNSSGGAGVLFGINTGTSTQANNKTINTGAFTGGPLYIRNFTQSGPTTGNTSNVSITGANQLLSFNNSSFYDNVTGSSQMIDCITSTFRNAATLTKVSGNANNYWTGGNTFNGTTTLTNQSTFILGMANGTADAYNGNVSFVQSGTGAVSPSYNANCTYGGNITVTAPAGVTITFGTGASGISTMNGSGTQSISLVAGAVPVFTRFVMNHIGTGVTLNTRINISNSLTMTLGKINTTAVNIVNLNNASTTNIGNSASYINGPINYDMAFTGARTLNFPIGKVADWRPAILNLNHSAATPYTYNSELFNAPAPTTWTFPATIDTVSGVHYWVINRYNTGSLVSVPATGLSGNQTITLYFDVNDQVYDGANLTIVKNTVGAPTAWIDIGGTGGPAALGGIALAGSVTSTSAPSAFNSFSTFTLGSKIGIWNPLPVEMLYFTGKPVEQHVQLDWATATEINNSKFEIERSKDGVTFDYVATVSAYGSGNSTTTQIYQTRDSKPLSGLSYYRLKQIDKNGAYKYTNLAQVNFDKRSFVSIYPNPAVNNIFINVSTDYDNATVKIIDALGREVLSQTIDSSAISTITTNTLEPGMYYVIIANGTEVNKTKITIQK